MTIGNRGLYGSPALPYIDYRSYEGVDVFLDLAFLDYTGTLQTPSAIVYQVDDITNVQNMIPPTVVAPTGPTMLLQLPGPSMIMSRVYEGSQLCQVYITATLPPVQPKVIVPLASNISLLLHGDQTPLIDSSNYNNPLTVGSGAAPPIFSTAQFEFGPGSISFPAASMSDASQAIQIPFTPGTALDILPLPSGVDFTIDGWVYLTSPGTNGACVFDYGNTLTGTNEVQFAIGSLGGSNTYAHVVTNVPSWQTLGLASSSPLTLNAWNYFAIVRQGTAAGNAALFIGNVRCGAAANWTAAYATVANPVITVGYEPGTNTPSAPFFLDEMRVIKGTALYSPASTTITPPTAPVTNTIIPASAAPTVRSITIIELCTIQTPTGIGQ